MAGRAATAVKTDTRSKPRAPTGSGNSTLTAKKEAPTKTRRRSKVETRTRIYWAVFNQDLKRVAVFEFDQKAEAEKRVAKLMDASGDHHFIQKIKATVPA